MGSIACCFDVELGLLSFQVERGACGERHFLETMALNSITRKKCCDADHPHHKELKALFGARSSDTE
jgi:hypothetical protein